MGLRPTQIMKTFGFSTERFPLMSKSPPSPPGIARGQPVRLIRFGAFEVDLAAGELRKNGRKIKLQDQPFRVLTALLARPDEVVTREELRAELWPDDTYVDFDRSLNTAVNKLRDAVGDSASRPRLIETLPRRGYRFLGQVEVVGGQTVKGDLGEQASDRREAPAVLAARKALEETQKRLKTTQVALAALVLLLAIVAAAWLRSPKITPPTPPVTFGLSGNNVREPAISPDGRHIAYVAGEGPGKLWVQDLDQVEPRAIQATEGARYPFWSPESDFIGFAAGTELRKVPLAGGPPVLLCLLPDPFPQSRQFRGGGAWSPDGGSIVFPQGVRTRLYEVASNGGDSKLLLDPPEGEDLTHRDPHFLPLQGRRMLLFTQQKANASEIVLRDLDTGEQEVLAEGASPVYSPSGHVVYQTSVRTGGLWALPFSADTLKPSGEAFSVAENGWDPGVSDPGALVYLERDGEPIRQLVWRDRAGNELGRVGQPKPDILIPELSPDDRRIGLTRSGDIWIHDIARSVETRLSFHPAIDFRSVWSPSGDRILFSSRREGFTDIFVRSADGSGEPKELAASPFMEDVCDWSPDGRSILFVRRDQQHDENLWYLRLKDDGDYEEISFVRTPFSETHGDFSPDGRFVAYLSNESGRYEVYVRRFPDGEGKVQITSTGGVQSSWSRDGKELFYVEDVDQATGRGLFPEGGTLMSVPVTTTPRFTVGSPRRLFRSTGLAVRVAANYDVSADGQRFLIPELLEEESVQPVIRVVLNWYEEFREESE